MVESEDEGVEVDTTIPLIPVTVDVKQADGSEATVARTLTCVQEQSATHDFRRLTSSSDSPDEHRLWGMQVDTSDGASTCELRIEDWSSGEQGIYVYEDLTLDPEGVNEFTVDIPETVLLTGQVTAPPGSPASGTISARDQKGRWVHQVSLDEAGRYALPLPRGEYDLTVSKTVGNNAMEKHVRGFDLQDDTELDVSMPSFPVTVHLVGEDGLPTEGRTSLSCFRPNGGPNEELANDYLYTDITGSGAVTLPGLPTADGWSCYVYNPDPDGIPVQLPNQPEIASGTELTLVVATGMLIEGPPSTSVDDDGVPDLVEAQAPNNGDGNSDGTPDHQQANVTSLPANGAGPGGRGELHDRGRARRDRP